MKWSYRIVVIVFAVFVILGLVWVSPFNYLFKGVKLTYLQGEKSAHLTDWYGFDTREVSNANRSRQFPVASGASEVPLSSELLDMLNETQSSSYLVFRNDSLICEQYFNGFSDTHRTNSFSMAKTVVTLLTQKAIEMGYIPSWDVRVKSYLPWLTGPYSDKVTLRHLSTMTSGLEWDENYLSPLGVTAKAYYTDDIEGVMRTIPISSEPGIKWQYQSGSTQLLAMALLQGLKSPKNNQKEYQHISDFASDQIWSPLGMEASARWSLDHKNGMELGFCCLNAISRDFGRLGLWVLNNGKWGGANIDSSFLSMAQKGYKDDRYGHSFWISKQTETPFTYFQGLGGQYIVMIPSQNMVVVRTGNGIVFNESLIFDDVKTYVREAVRLFGKY